jgi:hypothetical protein
MKISQLFPSKYVKAVDLNGKTVTLTIAKLAIEELGHGPEKERKPVLYFERATKGLVLNRTNAMTILFRHAVFIEPLPPVTPVGHHASEESVIAFAVVVFDQVAKFVHDHIVNQRLVEVDQLKVERNRAIGAATAPTRFHAPDRQFGEVVEQPLKFGKVGHHPAQENGLGLLTAPFLQVRVHPRFVLHIFHH